MHRVLGHDRDRDKRQVLTRAVIDDGQNPEETASYSFNIMMTCSFEKWLRFMFWSSG
jgi:hypothetical protein